MLDPQALDDFCFKLELCSASEFDAEVEETNTTYYVCENFQWDKTKKTVIFHAPDTLFKSTVIKGTLLINNTYKWLVLDKKGENNTIIARYLEKVDGEIRIKLLPVLDNNKFQAIDMFRKGACDLFLRDAIVDPKTNGDDVQIPLVIPQGLPKLNASQEDAALFALSHKLTCIQGPPGTGKSRLISYLANSFAASKLKVLVVTHTNAATDVLALKIDECSHGHFCRPVSKSYQASASPEVQAFFPKTSTMINNKSIVVTTIDMSYMLEDYQCDVVIVDEASQVVDSDLILPLFTGCKRLILVGDPQQLAPFMRTNIAKKNGFNQNLIRRAFDLQEECNTEFEVHFLNTQYRMHESICNYVSSVFYNNRLNSATNRHASKFFKQWPNREFPIILWNSESNEERDEQSWANPKEAQMAFHLALHLIRNGMNPSNIAIIVPYIGQLQLLVAIRDKYSHPNQIKGIVMKTVDSVQGDERDVVIISTVRTSKLGFFSEPNRINVAISRAKEGLFILGKPQLLKNDPSWLPLVFDCAANQSILKGNIPNLETDTIEF